MNTNNILQPLDVNAAKMDRSPARKRPRYESPVKERWSLTNNSVRLDDVYDYGVGVLDSDSDTQSDDEIEKHEKDQYTCQIVVHDESSNSKLTCKSSDDICDKDSTSCPSPDCDTLSERTRQNINLTELDQFYIRRDEIKYHDAYKIDYFQALSDEVILQVFHFLPKKQLSQVACVSNRFHRLANDESLWARLDASNRVLYQGVLGKILSRQVIILRLAQSEILSPAILPNCFVADECFESRLLYLDMSMIHISTSCLAFMLSKCKRLKKLSLEHVNLDNNVMQSVSGNDQLEVLNLTMAVGLELGGLTSVLKKCRKLRELNFAWTFLSKDSINYICSNLPHTLDRLNISGCRKLLTDENVLDIVKLCKGLRELDLSDCTGLTGNVINHIVSLKELGFLALSRCYLIPYRALLSLKKMECLLYLDVHGGYIEFNELTVIQQGLGPHVQMNKFKFSSVARPTVGGKRSTIWNLRVRD